jgi:hypothetical protein
MTHQASGIEGFQAMLGLYIKSTSVFLYDGTSYHQLTIPRTVCAFPDAGQPTEQFLFWRNDGSEIFGLFSL